MWNDSNILIRDMQVWELETEKVVSEMMEKSEDEESKDFSR